MYNRFFNFLKSIFYIWIYLLINQIFIYYLLIKLFNINTDIIIFFLNQDSIIRYFFYNTISLLIIFLFLLFKIYIFKDYNFIHKITFMYSKLFNYFIKFLKKLLISALLIYIISYTFDLNLAQKSANPILKASLNLTDSQTKIAIGCASAIFLFALYRVGYLDNEGFLNFIDKTNKYYVENVTGPLILRDIQRNIPVIVESNKKISKFYFNFNNYDILHQMHFTKEIEKQLSYLYLNHYKFHEIIFPVLLGSKSCFDRVNNRFYRNKFTLEELSFIAIAIRMKASESVEVNKIIKNFEKHLFDNFVNYNNAKIFCNIINEHTYIPTALNISDLRDSLYKEYMGYFNIGFWEKLFSYKTMEDKMGIIGNIVGVYKNFYLPPSPFKNHLFQINDFSNFALSFNLKLLTVISYPLFSITSFISGIPNPIPRDTFWSIVLNEYDILDSLENQIKNLKLSLNDTGNDKNRVCFSLFKSIDYPLKDYVYNLRFIKDVRKQFYWVNSYGNSDYSDVPSYETYTNVEEKEFEDDGEVKIDKLNVDEYRKTKQLYFNQDIIDDRYNIKKSKKNV